jgi:hypothetical protein
MNRSIYGGLALALMVLGCSSSEDGISPSVGPDAGDAGRPDSAPPPPDPNTVTCGDGPHQEIAVQVNKISAQGVGSSVTSPVQVQWSGCSASLTTTESGKGTVKLSTSVSPRSVKVIPGEGFIPSLYAEAAVVAGSISRKLRVFPDVFKALPAQGWDDARGFILVEIAPLASEGICAQKDGVTLSVKNHPELKVSYLESVTKIAGSSKTTAYGFATIPSAPPGEKLEIVATKPQCDATTLDAAGIGLVPVEAGVISLVSATLTDPAPGPTCGPGPYVTFTGEVLRRSSVDYSVSPVMGATTSFSNCPGVSATTRADGTFALQMTKDVPMTLSITKTGFIGYRLAELTATGRSWGSLRIRGDEWKALEPGWNDAGVSLYVAIEPSGTGACAAPDGVTVAVKDHPEAVAHYLDPSTPPVEVGGATATTTRGYVVFTGLPAGRYQFQATTTKACKLSTTSFQQSGFLDAKAGSFNLLNASIADP